MMSGRTHFRWLTRGMALASLLAAMTYPALAFGISETRAARCLATTSCTVSFHASQTGQYPRQVVCTWTQDSATPRARKALLSWTTTFSPVSIWVLPYAVDSVSASSNLLNQTIQTGSLIFAKDGDLDLQLEFTAPVTLAISCTLFSWKT